jgi:hypothetical protein
MICCVFLCIVDFVFVKQRAIFSFIDDIYKNQAAIIPIGKARI